jgi:hypothetical protein
VNEERKNKDKGRNKENKKERTNEPKLPLHEQKQ